MSPDEGLRARNENSADCFGGISFFQVIDVMRSPCFAVSKVAPSVEKTSNTVTPAGISSCMCVVATAPSVGTRTVYRSSASGFDSRGRTLTCAIASDGMVSTNVAKSTILFIGVVSADAASLRRCSRHTDLDRFRGERLVLRLRGCDDNARAGLDVLHL